tara:strand:- start:317 stop:544 length:228 start_codon:yes stop_codon:yes gene_type:complete
MASFQVKDGGPVVEYDDSEIVILGSEKVSGFFESGYKVKYSKANNTNVKSSFNISEKPNKSRGLTMGGIKLKFHW